MFFATIVSCTFECATGHSIAKNKRIVNFFNVLPPGSSVGAISYNDLCGKKVSKGKRSGIAAREPYLYLIASSGLIVAARRAGKTPVTKPMMAEKTVTKAKNHSGKLNSPTAAPPKCTATRFKR